MPPKRIKLKKPRQKLEKAKLSLKKIKYEEDCTSFPCKYCAQEFTKNAELEEHLKLCGALDNNIKKPKYVCKECPKKFRFSASYLLHCQNDHSKTPNSISCNQCSVTCPDAETLQEHVQKVHERDIFQCPSCCKEFVRRSHVMRHMAQSGCNGEVYKYPCEICTASFTRKDNLMVHLRTKHIMASAYKCKYCDYASKNYCKYVNHWHSTHSGTPNIYECNHCRKVTGSRAAMTKHLEIHGDKKYTCQVCGYSTYTVEVMRRHVLTHVPDKPFKCSLCSQSYIQRQQLQRHLAKHAGNMCIQCGESFPTIAKLLIHKRDHMGMTKLFCPFETCPVKTRQFPNEESLQVHLKSHVANKNFRCEICSHGFHSETMMQRHLATHALDRPRRCMYCVRARAYVRGEHLVRHVRNVHPAIFKNHLTHVRQVLGNSCVLGTRVSRSEMESILNVLDAESDRIMDGYSGTGVLYAGYLDDQTNNESETLPKSDDSPLMTEEELAENLNKLLSNMIDRETLECFGWPDESVDEVLEKVIEHCGAKPADKEKWTRVQRLRENAKHLFLYVIEDENIAKMLDTHTIDQIIKHILNQVTEDVKPEMNSSSSTVSS